ncbi:MAG: hypothetical protein PVG66_04140 [Chromatiales bacterium]|jgi:hypothetical protein
MKIQHIFVIFILSVMLAGCTGSGMVRPVVNGDKTTLHTEDYAPSTWNLPLGSVVPEGSNLVLHRQPSKSAGFSLLFGPLGVIIANESLKTETREKVSALDVLRTLEVKHEVDEILSEMYRNGELGSNTSISHELPKEHHYLLQPYVLLESDRESSAQISVVLKVEEKIGEGNGWKGQYVRHLPWQMDLHTLSNGNSSIDSEWVRRETLNALRLSLKVMAMDLEGSINSEEVKVKFEPKQVVAWSFLDELRGRMAGELDDQYFLIRTDYGAGAPFLHGLHILNKDQVAILSR